MSESPQGHQVDPYRLVHAPTQETPTVPQHPGGSIRRGPHWHGIRKQDRFCDCCRGGAPSVGDLRHDGIPWGEVKIGVEPVA
jgi:hypothetical protein